MQTIHHTSHPTGQVPPPGCFADRMALLIDAQARTGVAIADGLQRQAEPVEANSLIWIESDQALGEPCRRGVLVVGHGACLAVKEWSCVISYPSGTTDRGEGVLDVSESLAGLGWVIVSCVDRVTAVGRASIAVLVIGEPHGQELRLWLAASSMVPAGGGPVTRQWLPRDAQGRLPPPSAEPAPPTASPPTAPGTRDQVETWVNEGGAGDDVSG